MSNQNPPPAQPAQPQPQPTPSPPPSSNQGGGNATFLGFDTKQISTILSLVALVGGGTGYASSWGNKAVDEDEIVKEAVEECKQELQLHEVKADAKFYQIEEKQKDLEKLGDTVLNKLENMRPPPRRRDREREAP